MIFSNLVVLSVKDFVIYFDSEGVVEFINVRFDDNIGLGIEFYCGFLVMEDIIVSNIYVLDVVYGFGGDGLFMGYGVMVIGIWLLMYYNVNIGFYVYGVSISVELIDFLVMFI